MIPKKQIFGRRKFDYSEFLDFAKRTMNTEVDSSLIQFLFARTCTACSAFDLIYKISGTQSFDDSMATVFSDGTVYWNRAGSLTPQCHFVGLEKMPFDQLGCQLHFGGGQKKSPRIAQQVVKYKLQEKMIDGTLHRGFYALPYSQSYMPFKLVREKSSCDYHETDLKQFYPLAMNSTFHVDLFFQRSTRHYSMFIIFPNIVFVVMSFGQFLLDIDSGERLSFGVTIVLIMVTQSVVVSSFLPLSQEKLWINQFNFNSMIFTMLPLLVTLSGCFLLRRERYLMESSELEQKNSSDNIPNHVLENHYCEVEGDNVNDEKDNNVQEEISMDELYENNSEHDIVARNLKSRDSKVVTRDEKSFGKVEVESSSKKQPTLITSSKMKMLVNLVESIRNVRWKLPRKKMRLVFVVDRVFFILLPTAYVLCLIGMFLDIFVRRDPQMNDDDRYKTWLY